MVRVNVSGVVILFRRFGFLPFSSLFWHARSKKLGDKNFSDVTSEKKVTPKLLPKEGVAYAFQRSELINLYS